MTACAEYLHPPEMQKRCESQIPHWLFFERGSRFPYFLLMTVTSQRAGSRTAGASVAWGLDTSQRCPLRAVLLPGLGPALGGLCIGHLTGEANMDPAHHGESGQPAS